MREGKIAEYSGEKRYIHKNGSIVWVNLTVSPMWSIGEDPDYYIAVVEDITERKLIEEALRKSHEELAKAYDELKSAQVRVLHQEKMASIGQLAAGVAHEINNPIGFISSNLNSLRRYTDKIAAFSRMQITALENISGNGDSQIKEILDEIREQKKSIKFDYIVDDLGNIIDESLDGANRVRGIVRDLKSFSRNDESEFKMADINAGIESTINIVWNELKYKATLKKEFGDIPPTKCNIGQLNQVFMNILVNAAHAIPAHGTITVKTWSAGSNIYVSITDTGTGIPADILSKIFDPFFTTKEVGSGTGLGLSIAYDIIKKRQRSDSAPQEVAEDKNQESLFDIVVKRLAGQGPPPHEIWLPPLDAASTLDQMLPNLTPTPDLGYTTAGWEGRGQLHAAVGVVDKPFEQRRDSLRLDFSGAAGHVGVVGGPRSGKSTLLRTLITLVRPHPHPGRRSSSTGWTSAAAACRARRPAARRRGRAPAGHREGAPYGRRGRRHPQPPRGVLPREHGSTRSPPTGAAGPRASCPARRAATSSWSSTAGCLPSATRTSSRSSPTSRRAASASASTWCCRRRATRRSGWPCSDQFRSRLELRLGDPLESEFDRKVARTCRGRARPRSDAGRAALPGRPAAHRRPPRGRRPVGRTAALVGGGRHAWHGARRAEGPYAAVVAGRRPAAGRQRLPEPAAWRSASTRSPSNRPSSTSRPTRTS